MPGPNGGRAGLGRPVGEGAQPGVDDAQRLDVGVPAVAGLPAFPDLGDARADSAGTVYRHFPSKEVLFEAVVAEHVDALAAAADRWAARAAPGDALFGFLLEVIETSAGRQHLCDTLSGDKGWPRALLAAAARRFHAGLERLLRDAQAAGAVRADLRADDLAALAFGGAAMCSAHRDRARGLRLARLLLDGLRIPAVTKSAPFRDADLPARHGTAVPGARHCEECGSWLRLQATGRPPRYCSAACRQRARRRRAASGS